MSEVGRNDIDFPPNQLLNCSCNTLRLMFRVQKIRDEILALNISGFAQALVKCGVDW